MKILSLSIYNIESLKTSIEQFFINNIEDYAFFSPHEYSFNGIIKVMKTNPKDYFCFLIDEDIIAGYGLLRGWSEGYDIPSLGIMIDANYRGKNLSKLLMNHLHQIAIDKGSKKIRLRVYKENLRAISLYNNLGYTLSDYNKDTFVGFKNL